MQSKSFGNEEEIKKLREMVKKNQPGAKPSAETPAAEPPEDQANGEVKPTDKPETPQDRVWKQYKKISGEGEAPKEKHNTVKKDEEASEDEEETADNDEESAEDINSLLDQYKNRNKAEMSSRSFARPEDLEKSLKKSEVEQPQDQPKAEARAADEQKQTIENKKAKAAKKKPDESKHGKKSGKAPRATSASYNN